jgi:hypothetical protein
MDRLVREVTKSTQQAFKKPQREKASVSLSSFSLILTPQNRIETPGKIKDVSGYNAATYDVSNHIYMHFSDVHSASEFKQVLDQMEAITHKSVKAKVWGDELVVTLPKRVFQKAFLALQLN